MKTLRISVVRSELSGNSESYENVTVDEVLQDENVTDKVLQENLV